MYCLFVLKRDHHVKFLGRQHLLIFKQQSIYLHLLVAVRVGKRECCNRSLGRHFWRLSDPSPVFRVNWSLVDLRQESASFRKSKRFTSAWCSEAEQSALIVAQNVTHVCSN